MTPAATSVAAGGWRRLLVPLDGTPVSASVLDFAAPVLRAADEVHLLRVVRPGEASGPARAHLEGVMRAPGPRDELRAGGHPASEILEAAARLEPDLVAMATRGGASTRGAAYGSVAGQVARRCTAPSLVLNPLTHRLVAAGVRRLFVPFDGSPACVAGLAAVADLARTYGAEVTLAFVEGAGATADAVVEPHRRRLERSGLRARSLAVTAGRVPTRLLDAIEREAADLVVACTGGREGVVRWTLGTTAPALR